MIKADSLSKQYKKKSKNALDCFSAEFEKGKITGLVGENGAGKSTLLKILSLQMFPTSGKLYIDGKLIDSENYVSFKNRIGFVGENPDLDGNFTVRETLFNLCEFYGKDHSDAIEKYDELVKKFSLFDVEEKKIKTLSKGYCQRLSFALAFANNPEILLLDEPISGLDPVQIKELRSLILSEKDEKTIILSTHIMQEIDLLCDKVIFIHNGVAIASGTEREILESTGKTSMEQAFLALTEEGQK